MCELDVEICGSIRDLSVFQLLSEFDNSGLVWHFDSIYLELEPSVCICLHWNGAIARNQINHFLVYTMQTLKIRNEEMTVGLCHSHHSNGKNSHRAAFAITQTTLYTALHHVELISTTFRPFCNSQTSSQIMTVQMFFFRHLQSSFCLSASMFFKHIHT